jgi:glycerol-3-phosphate dehydrogenase subunit C
MTTTYDPTHPKYFDNADLREEMNRVYDLCHGCRVCVNLCTSFPTLFDAVDRHDSQESHLLTVAEQDKVVDECFNCKKCGDVTCPYTPGQQHEWQLDFPGLMMRAKAVKFRESGSRNATDQILGRTDLLGAVATRTAPIANAITQSPGSLPRKLLEKTMGIAAQRVLPPYARTRFSTWMKRRAKPMLANRQASVAVFPTCVVEYQNPAIGHDLVKVYEHNGVACSLAEGAGCCGAPWLHNGDIDQFRAQAAKNVAPLAAAVRAGNDIVVPQPTCSFVLKNDYPLYLKGTTYEGDAKLIGAHTFDSSEYLWKLHKGEGTSISTEFSGSVPETITYHVSCHLQAQRNGLKSRDLMKLTGAKISLVNRCSGVDGTWGYRATNYDIAKKIAKPLGDAIVNANGAVVTGDCNLANGAIDEETGIRAVHPLQVMARAYGIRSEQP